VGDLLEYRLAHQDILAGAVTVKMAGQRVEGLDKAIWLGEGSRVDFTAGLKGSVLIGKNVRVGANARISNSVIGDGCVIEDRAVVSDCVLWDNVSIGTGAVLTENVVGRGSEVKARARLFEGALVSDACCIGEGSVVKADVKVWPQKLVEDGAILSASLVWGTGARSSGRTASRVWATWRSRRSLRPSWGRPSAPPSGSTPSSAPAGTRIGPVDSSTGP
jgi:mannose-1-phosphate guanylyltransferase/phosphomannomutase